MPNRSAVSATSVGCFIWSAICFRLYQKARSDVKELSSAVEITVRSGAVSKLCTSEKSFADGCKFVLAVYASHIARAAGKGS